MKEEGVQNSMPKFQLCSQCRYVFTRRTNKYYCCNKNLPVCSRCIKKICKVCKMARNKRLSVSCAKCTFVFDQDFIFFDFRKQQRYCAKCLSQNYIYHYEKMVKEGSEPKNYLVEIAPKSQHSIEDLIIFYKNWCFCCLKTIKKNAYEMVHGARICSQCLETNFDLAMPKLIMCVQCNGYIHERAQIQFQITLTEILCVYCSKDEKKMYEALMKKHQAEQAKISKVKSKPSMNNSNILVSAIHLSKIGASKMVKVVSKSSIEQESLDIPIKVNIQHQSLICLLCNCKFNQKSVFKLNDQEIDKYKQSKQNKNLVICFVCYKKPQKRLERVFGLSEKELKEPQQSMNIGKIRSNKIISTQIIPKSPSKGIIKPLVNNRVASPNVKSAVCQKCKKSKASIETKDGSFCLKCLN